MKILKLCAQELTASAFAPYGEVIECSRVQNVPMNDARFDRFDNLCSIDVGDDGEVAVGIVRSRIKNSLPYRIEIMERHPLGTQAFIPLFRQCFVVVVAPPGPDFEPADLRAFHSNGSQGINYWRGTWHMPLISLEVDESFLVIDRSGHQSNTDIRKISSPVILNDLVP